MTPNCFGGSHHLLGLWLSFQLFLGAGSQTPGCVSFTPHPPLCICIHMHIDKRIWTCVWHYMMMRTHIFVFVCVCVSALMQNFHMLKLNSDKWTTNNSRLCRQLLLNQPQVLPPSLPSKDGLPCATKSKYSLISFHPVKTHSVPSQSNFCSNKETNSNSSILKWLSVGPLHCNDHLFPFQKNPFPSSLCLMATHGWTLQCYNYLWSC